MGGVGEELCSLIPLTVFIERVDVVDFRCYYAGVHPILLDIAILSDAESQNRPFLVASQIATTRPVLKLSCGFEAHTRHSLALLEVV